MRTARENRLLALWIGAILVFFAQSMFCFAEHAVPLGCAPEVEHQQGAGSSEQESTAKCCHTHCDGSIIFQADNVPVGGLHGDVSLKAEATAPGGALRDIDHPPQFS
jgi:hypothetical protein